MTAIDASFGGSSFRNDRAARNSLLWLLPWGAALAFGAGLGTWATHARHAVEPDIVASLAANRPPVAATSPARLPAANPYGGLVALAVEPAASKGQAASLEARLEAAAALAAPRLAFTQPGKSANPYGELVDPGFLKDAEPASLVPPPTVEAKLEAAPATAAPPVFPEPPRHDLASLDEAVPLPPVRPAEPARRAPQPDAKAVAAPPPPDDRNVFEKLFGMGRQPGAAVAYAEPESQAAVPARGSQLAATDRSSGFSLFSKSAPGPMGYDKLTAVYDISARTLYMPDGTRIEAHSGLGDRLDDPRFVSERNRGATPPHLYDLSLREDLFHGVQALRLTPIGDGDVFGRAGLLAHPFMLGPNGDSNGCVSIRDYDVFLHAFEQGQIKRLAVVARL